MESQNREHKTSSFWFGFLLGIGTTTIIAFLLGTKKGRKMLHQILELSENIEENLALFMEEWGEKVENKELLIDKHPNLHTLLNKIKSSL